MLRSRKDKMFDALIILVLCIVLVIVLYPLYFVVIASVSDPIQVIGGKVILKPIGFNFEAYKRVFKYEMVMRGYGNTLMYTAAGTTLNLVMTVLAAYPLSRRKLHGKGFVLGMMGSISPVRQSMVMLPRISSLICFCLIRLTISQSCCVLLLKRETSQHMMVSPGWATSRSMSRFCLTLASPCSRSVIISSAPADFSSRTWRFRSWPFSSARLQRAYPYFLLIFHSPVSENPT